MGQSGGIDAYLTGKFLLTHAPCFAIGSDSFAECLGCDRIERTVPEELTNPGNEPESWPTPVLLPICHGGGINTQRGGDIFLR